MTIDPWYLQNMVRDVIYYLVRKLIYHKSLRMFVPDDKATILKMHDKNCLQNICKTFNQLKFTHL